MSHYSVLVITNGPEEVEAALAPFHEFECTGEVDQYVIDVDETENARQEYEAATVEHIKLEDGTVVPKRDDRFFRPFTEKELEGQMVLGTCGWCALGWYERRDWDETGNREPRLYVEPSDDLERIIKPLSEQVSFLEWATDYYSLKSVGPEEAPKTGKDEPHMWGYIRRTDTDEVDKIIRRTNPNAKWDWWQIGGRWSGMLESNLMGTVAGDVRKGQPGVAGSQMNSQGCDQTYRRHLDLVKMQRQNIDRRRARVAKAFQQLQNESGLSEAKVRDLWTQHAVAYKDTVAAAEAAGQPIHIYLDEHPENPTSVVREARILAAMGDFFGAGVPDTEPDIDRWINDAPALSSWAVLKDGQWYEQGSMGWWGMASDEMPEDEWRNKLHELISGLDPNAYLSVVDCHI